MQSLDESITPILRSQVSVPILSCVGGVGDYAYILSLSHSRPGADVCGACVSIRDTPVVIEREICEGVECFAWYPARTCEFRDSRVHVFVYAVRPTSCASRSTL